MGYRIEFLNFNSRQEPKTSNFCIKCQKDLKPNQPRRWVHLINGGPWVLHPEDEAAYPVDGGDLGFHAIGLDCARRLGLEWSIISPECDAITSQGAIA